MRKGFIITAITVVLFLLLLGLAFEYKSKVSSRATSLSELMDAKKVIYTWDDVMEDMENITGVRITQNGTNLTFYDDIPSLSNVTNALKGYGEFIDNYYRTSEMEMRFLTLGDTPINLSEMNATVVVEPFNLLYYYPTFDKSFLCIYLPQSNASAVENVTFNFRIISGNFSTLPPSPQWSPSPSSCDPVTNPECIPMVLMLTDKNWNVYTAPYDQYDLSAKSEVKDNIINDTGSEICNFDVRFGQAGYAQSKCKDYMGADIISVEEWGSGPLCNMTIEISFIMNTTEYFINFPNKLRVRDINYNISKKDYIS